MSSATLDVGDVLNRLLSEQCPLEVAPASVDVGVYAFFLRRLEALASIEVGRSRVLYVGMTQDGFDGRNHLTCKHSGFSTFRRSLGALLKGQLDLVAHPRSSGRSPHNLRNYRFSDAGELRVTEWMMRNLTYSKVAVASDIRSLEKSLIKELEPPINLTDWKNPQRAFIRSVRFECHREAVAVGKIEAGILAADRGSFTSDDKIAALRKKFDGHS